MTLLQGGITLKKRLTDVKRLIVLLTRKSSVIIK